MEYQNNFSTGKVDNTIKEMLRLNIDILGVRETRWPNTGMCEKNGTTFHYAVNNDPNHRNGVGFIIKTNIRRSIRNFFGYSDRVFLLQLYSKPVNKNLIQVYALNGDKQQIQEVLRSLKPHEITIIVGDFNAEVGNGRVMV